MSILRVSECFSGNWPRLCEEDHGADHGRGLVLVSRCTDGRWGARPRPVGIGKFVWADLGSVDS